MYILFLAMFAVLNLAIVLVAIGRANIYAIVFGSSMLLLILILTIIEIFGS